jgi:probable rRNA maturation factor
VTYDVALDRDDALDPAALAPFDLVRLAALAQALLAAADAPPGAAATVLLATDERLRELNRAHRGLDEPTDVLSFPAEEGEAFPAAPGEPRYLGDIAVSLPATVRQATAAGLEPQLELAHVMAHGLLHLLGHDHETPADDAAMRAREEALLGPAIHAGRAHDD